MYPKAYIHLTEIWSAGEDLFLFFKFPDLILPQGASIILPSLSFNLSSFDAES